MDVSIIIVNYNTLTITENCIDSVIKFSEGFDFEIILVDNGSSDGSKEAFEKRKDIIYIYSDDNLGFGRANNLGAKVAKGEFLFFLNSDTIFIDNSVEKMISFFQQNERKLNIGSLGTILIDKLGNFNGAGSVMPSCRNEITNYLKQFLLFKKFYKKNIPIVSSEQSFYEIGYVIGADLLMKKNLFDTLNGFDPVFFMYYEESDLQFRMKQKGFKSYIYSKTSIIHLEDGSGKQIKEYNNRKRIIVHTSKNIFLKKNDSKNFRSYQIFDKFYLLISRLRNKYSVAEQKEYEEAIKKTYK